jgi:hypothetical protein
MVMGPKATEFNRQRLYIFIVLLRVCCGWRRHPSRPLVSFGIAHDVPGWRLHWPVLFHIAR